MIKYLSKVSKSALSGTALLRLDFNSKDNWRLKTALPTVKLLLKHASKIVILSHRGRPTFVKTSVDKPRGVDKKFSLARDANKLREYLGRRVNFIPDFNFGNIAKKIKSAPPKSVFVLENLRFLSGEEKNDVKLAKKLASLGDYYVNEAFAVCHRANASVAAITKFLPSYAGLGLEKEIEFLSRVMKKPRHPLVLVLGGAKAADKLGVLEYFRNKTGWFLLGGAAANTILYLKGFNVKKSAMDKNKSDLKQLRAVISYKNLVLPADFKWNKDMILDIGPRSIKEFIDKISSAKTIIWSGPMGLFEKKGYERGTYAVARAIAGNRRAFTLAGGGETVMFLKSHRLDKKFSFISTGGGAMLEFLAGKKLSGIKALE